VTLTHVSLTGRITSVSSITGSGIEISAPAKMGGRRRARTVIGRALLKNIADIDVLAQSLIHLIDERIDELKHAVPPNEPEACEAHHNAIADYEKLRERVEAFIESASGDSPQGRSQSP
jgi:hypothetical protein